MRDQETADEIAQIDHELEILRSRQALVARWDRITKVYCAITLPVIAGLSTVLVYAWSSDILMAAFIFGMAAVVAALMWVIGGWTIGQRSSAPPHQQRPSQFPPIGEFPPFGIYGFSPWRGPNYKSDADTIQT